MLVASKVCGLMGQSRLQHPLGEGYLSHDGFHVLTILRSGRSDA